MKTNRLFALSLFTVLIAIVLTDQSFAFRCGTELVDEGDTKYEVTHKCGEPDHIESWEEERIQRDFSLNRRVLFFHSCELLSRYPIGGEYSSSPLWYITYIKL
jgi:hypothetical protein